MLKFVGKPTVTFAEFPDEIALIFSISNCPGTCKNCSEPELRQDIGSELTPEILDKYISENRGISVIGFMGGDRDHKEIQRLSKFIHENGLKVGMYSGMDEIDVVLLECLDFYKYGRWIPFEGPEETWKDQRAGPLCLKNTNQVYLEKVGDEWINETKKFQRKKINDWKSVIA